MFAELILPYLFDGLFLYQLTASLLTYCILSTVLFFRQRAKRYQLFEHYGIPGSKPRLLDGHLHHYLLEPAGFKVDQTFQSKYGKFFGTFIGDEPSVVLSDPELIRRAFLERNSSFKARTTSPLETPLSSSLLFARYHRWKSMRKVMSPAFSAYTIRGDSATEFIDDSIRLMLEYLEQKFKQLEVNGGGEGDGRAPKSIEVDMHELMKATALHLISSMAIRLPDVGVNECESHVRSLDAYLSAVDSGVVIYAIRFPFLKRLLSFLSVHFEHDSTMKLIHAGITRRIDETLESLAKNKGQLQLKRGEQPQLIDKFVQLHYEGKLTRQEVIGNAEAILYAGYDTTSTALTYILWTLGKHVEVQERLRNELMAHGINSKYLEQVMYETMRLYPTVIAFTTRLATETVSLGDGLVVPQGSRIVYHAWLIYRNAKIWPEPDKFDPERFRKGADIHPCAFAPFGLGDRKCLGNQLALLEMKMQICDILMRYRLRSKAPLDLELVSHAQVLTAPKEKIVIQMEKL